MNRANFATPISIAPFGLRTVVTATSRWVSHEVWSEAQTLWFADMRNRFYSGFLKTPKTLRQKNKRIQPQYGAWILTIPDQPDQPLAWAELHTYVSGFNHGFLMVGGEKGPILEHVEVLITAVALWGRGDILDVYFVGNTTCTLEAALTRPLITVSINADLIETRPMFERSQMHRVDLHEWMQLPKVSHYVKALSSLRMLAEAMRHKEARAQGMPRKRARGILERLFRPWS